MIHFMKNTKYDKVLEPTAEELENFIMHELTFVDNSYVCPHCGTVNKVTNTVSVCTHCEEKYEVRAKNVRAQKIILKEYIHNVK